MYSVTSGLTDVYLVHRSSFNVYPLHTSNKLFLTLSDSFNDMMMMILSMRGARVVCCLKRGTNKSLCMAIKIKYIGHVRIIDVKIIVVIEKNMSKNVSSSQTN